METASIRCALSLHGRKWPRKQKVQVDPRLHPVTQLTAHVSESQGMASWSGVTGLVSFLQKDFIMITECFLKKKKKGR